MFFFLFLDNIFQRCLCEFDDDVDADADYDVGIDIDVDNYCGASPKFLVILLFSFIFLRAAAIVSVEFTCALFEKKMNDAF